jgi:hypothetical protein
MLENKTNMSENKRNELEGIKTLTLIPSNQMIKSVDVITDETDYLDFFVFEKNLEKIFGDRLKKLIDLLVGGESLTIDFGRKEIFLKNREKPKDKLSVFFSKIVKDKFINDDLQDD